MPHLAGNYDEGQEFWKPAVPLRQEAPQPGAAVQVCKGCGADFLTAARFCHVCGAERTAILADRQSIGTRAWMAVAALRDATENTNASLIALFLGVACIIAAVVTGFMYTATTILDWQAVQIWRIEWLLAGLAMFAGGILLKKR